MFLEGRPPVNVGVTSNGDVFGGTQISFGDVLGDKQFNLFAASIAQYRTLSLVLRQPVAPLPVRAAGLLADAVLLRAARRRCSTIRRSRRSSAATTRSRRARCAAAAPSASTRSTATAGSSSRAASSSCSEQYNDPGLAGRTPTQYQQQHVRHRRSSATARWCRSASRSSRRRRSSASSVRSPAARCGSRYDVAPKIGSTAVAPDLRRRRAPLPAARRAPACSRLRIRGFKSIGEFPDFIYFGGNSEMRGYDYLRVRRPERRVRQRRAALPAHRGGADADRRHRRHPRRVLRRTSAAAGSTISRASSPLHVGSGYKFAHDRRDLPAGHRRRADASGFPIPTRHGNADADLRRRRRQSAGSG